MRQKQARCSPSRAARSRVLAPKRCESVIRRTGEYANGTPIPNPPMAFW